jgi:hypothetical protein
VEVDIVDNFGESQRGRREIQKQEIDPEQYVQQAFTYWLSFNPNRASLFISSSHCVPGRQRFSSAYT